MAVDFKALLSKNVDDVKRPVPLPAGTYQGFIGTHKFDESKNKKTPFVRFMIKLTAPGNDVDPNELDGIELGKREYGKDYYLTPDADYRVKDLAASCGISVTGRSLGEVIEDIANVPVIVEMKHRNSEDGTEIYNEIGNVKGAV